MKPEQDIKPIPHMVDGRVALTLDEARAYLIASGYAAEAEGMIADALRWDNYRYTDDRHRYLARMERSGDGWLWRAGDCTASEERIKALGRQRKNRHAGEW
jgi:hypothetical protein